MREDARLILYACSGLLLTLISLYLYSALRNADSGCSVIITGERLTIRGCAFTPEFIEYAKTLEVARHW
uniref:Movement protein TGBp3 n=1 Tax=Garlic common latent virus TaxID=47900 RepID=Q67545_9VIRU|nr:7,6K protein [Garlic common latent virus]